MLLYFTCQVEWNTNYSSLNGENIAKENRIEFITKTYHFMDILYLGLFS